MKVIKNMFNKLELAIKRKLQKKANDRFFKEALPVGSACLLLTGQEPILCSIAGYLYEKSLGTIYNIILSVPNTEKSKPIRVSGEDRKLSSWLMVRDTIIENFWGTGSWGVMDHEMTYMEELSDNHNMYLICSVERLFDKTLIKREKRKIKVKVPNTYE
jgi:hypothetical protein